MRNSYICLLIVIQCMLLPGFLPAQTDPVEIGGIINAYSKVTEVDFTCDFVSVTQPDLFEIGDKVLLIQMQGARINETNSASFGDIIDYQSAGNYEYADVLYINGSNIYFEKKILHSYDPDASVQLIRTPVYNDATVISQLTCPPWNGNTGGIISLICLGTLELNAPINAAGLGFRGGEIGEFQSFNQCTYLDYFSSNMPALGGKKGEGIAQYIPGKEYARGKNANGGGGGNISNSGGGGGSNAGTGGIGGYEWTGCAFQTPNMGIGGLMIDYSITNDKVFMGGGGGGGNQNDMSATPGVAGGGIIILQFDELRPNNQTIFASGNTQTLNAGIDSGGGGGGGGSVLLSGNEINGNLVVHVTGGTGGSIVDDRFSVADQWGPGGGGGGGLLWLSDELLSSSINLNFAGGPSGITPFNNSWGATAGQPGIRLTGLLIPEGTTKEDITTERTLTFCKNSPNKVLQLECSGSVTWIAPYSDTIITSNELNITALDTAVQIIGICWNMFCPDSIVIFNIAIEDQTIVTDITERICEGDTIVYNGESINSPGIYSFTFINEFGCDSLVNLNLQFFDSEESEISATICFGSEYLFDGISYTQSGIYSAIFPDMNGCDSTVTLTLEVVSEIEVSLSATICQGETYTFGDQILSSEGMYVNNSQSTFGCDSTTILNLSINPVYNEQVEAMICKGEIFTFNDIEYNTQGVYIDSFQTASGCDSILSLNLMVSGPEPELGPDLQYCPDTDTIFLFPGNFSSYLWNDGASSTQFEVKAAGVYSVLVTDQFGCIAIDTINVVEFCELKYFVPDAFSPNQDGINDVFRAYFRQAPLQFELQIFDRWGERVAILSDPLETWNGTFKGEALPVGVYVWLAKIDGLIVHGNVLLSR